MMNIDYDTYELIADLLMNEDLSVEEIAGMANVSIDAVRYVDSAENE